MRKFFRDTKVIIFGVVGMIGIIISIGFNIKDAVEVGQIGLPTPAWTSIGLFLFFVCFFVLLYLWRKDMLVSDRETVDDQKVQRQIQTQTLPDTLTQEQVATRLAFIRRTKTVAEQLSQTVQGSYAVSLIRFIDDIVKENHVRERCKKDFLIEQVIRLIKHDLDILSANVSVYQSGVRTLDANVSDEQIRSACNDAVEMFHEVTRLIHEVFRLLDDLGMKGNVAVWEDTWQNRIKRDLGTTYDELIRLLKDMRSETPQQFESLIPKGSDLSNFASTFKIPWE